MAGNRYALIVAVGLGATLVGLAALSQFGALLNGTIGGHYDR